VPVSFEPCCVQLAAVRVNTHAAPLIVNFVLPSSFGPPTSAVLPSAESATLMPNSAVPSSSFPVSFAPWCFQVPPERVNTNADPPCGSFLAFSSK